MALFLSTFTNKIDKKGRLSVPSQFRAVLAGESFNGVIAYPSFINDCVEACGMSRMEKMYESIDGMDPFSEERDAFAASLLGASSQLPFDSEGRIVLADSLIAAAGLSEQAVFVGKGANFEIWEPARFTAYAEQARKVAKEKRDALRAIAGGSTPAASVTPPAAPVPPVGFAGQSFPGAPEAPHGYAPQGYTPQAYPYGYAPVPQGFMPTQQGYPQGFVPAAPHGYAPAPHGYAPAPQAYPPMPQGYAAAPQGGEAPLTSGPVAPGEGA